MPLLSHTFILLCHFFLSACAGEDRSKTSKDTGYDLHQPASTLILPDTLREISGIVAMDSNTIACIQDENGILFIYDLTENRIKEQIAFHFDGDYEGIAKVKNTIYVLRSDGTLFRIADYHTKKITVDSYNTGIPANNNEGLFYDHDNDRLLIACKGKINSGKEFKDKRVIYAFNLDSKELSPKAVFEFDIQKIRDFALQNGLEIPQKTDKKTNTKVPDIKFRTSAIAIHPINKKLYLLSATDHLLFIFDKDGTIAHIEKLDPQLFNKAEGITFLENGDMIISNEAQNKRPTLLLFSYKE